MMCGIFGTFDKGEIYNLFKINTSRGNHGFGLYSVCKHNYLCSKFPGNAIDKYKDIIADTIEHCEKNAGGEGEFIAGHLQAPTGSERKWNSDTAHPFDGTNWFIAHNGIIDNVDELCQKYGIKNEFTVDTQVILKLLDVFYEETHDELMSLKEALGAISGTAAVWVISKNTGNKYIYHIGSTLFANIESGTFSSIKCKEAPEELDEGCIYAVTNEGLVALCNASGPDASPFLVI